MTSDLLDYHLIYSMALSGPWFIHIFRLKYEDFHAYQEIQICTKVLLSKYIFQEKLLRYGFNSWNKPRHIYLSIYLYIDISIYR
jgi:hypothetical protein